MEKMKTFAGGFYCRDNKIFCMEKNIGKDKNMYIALLMILFVSGTGKELFLKDKYVYMEKAYVQRQS